ncbi:hypothetical protein DB88DRAFT_475291 [Papiliotrema laurentii]|uniref:Uncharacterized protein n=1 Tax=Papiliotrema laurentii TaxID=5418 RepID=A0AAD9FNH6_PAPLA|nr:hypothetical protein DB88DRAFT_475291 [Papiliotrema laurentii]
MPINCFKTSEKATDCDCFQPGWDERDVSRPYTHCRLKLNHERGQPTSILCKLGESLKCYSQTQFFPEEESMPRGCAPVLKDWYAILRGEVSQALEEIIIRGLRNNDHLPDAETYLKWSESNDNCNTLGNLVSQFLYVSETVLNLKSATQPLTCKDIADSSKSNKHSSKFTWKLKPTQTMRAHALRYAKAAAEKSSMSEHGKRQLVEEVLRPVITRYVSLLEEHDIGGSGLGGTYDQVKRSLPDACRIMLEMLTEAAGDQELKTVLQSGHMYWATFPSSSVSRDYSWNRNSRDKFPDSVKIGPDVNIAYINTKPSIDSTHVLIATVPSSEDAKPEILTCSPTFLALPESFMDHGSAVFSHSQPGNRTGENTLPEDPQTGADLIDHPFPYTCSSIVTHD